MFNTDLNNQIETLIEILKKNEKLFNIIEKAEHCGLDDYYISAGCINQTVWNYISGFPLSNGINDIDIVYFDNSDLSYEAENKIITRLHDLLDTPDIKFDIKNQARVHIWHEEKFGYKIEPYESLEDAINSWPTTATSIGLRKEDDKYRIYAPYGLNDLFGMIVKPNKLQITREVYEKKCDRWKSVWQNLKIIPW